MANVPEQVANLIGRFDENIESYQNQSYNETQVRREFIDPFFEALGWDEFAVYDCRLPPKESDKASKGRILYFNHSQYADRWEEIVSIFSKESVLRGSFDRFVDIGKGKRGTSPVDKEFLAEIESWREALAKKLDYHRDWYLNDGAQKHAARN
jgi:hypothetical protein